MHRRVIAHRLNAKRRTADVLINEKVDFSGLILSKDVLKGLKSAGFERPSPIQMKAIPIGRCGVDLIAQAKSGTGKTCVFSVIALESIILTMMSIQVLVLVPTREIAVQIKDVTNSIGQHMQGLHVNVFIGGLSIEDDKNKLKLCQIAIGTPGRVKHLIDSKLLSTSSIRLLILDEADKLLEENFQDQINWIFSTLPESKQVLALSATYPNYLSKHLQKYMRNPTFVCLNAMDPALEGIHHYFCTIPSHSLPHKTFDEKVNHLLVMLSQISFHQCLIFSNYQIRAKNLSETLAKNGFPSTHISGGQGQNERLDAMRKLKEFKCRILISTDLMSRGIDAERVNLVINMDLPRDSETYLHRVGRAGRYGSYGVAINFVAAGKEESSLKDIEIKCAINFDPLPEDLSELICKDAFAECSLMKSKGEILSFTSTAVTTIVGEGKVKEDDVLCCETTNLVHNGETSSTMTKENLVEGLNEGAKNKIHEIVAFTDIVVDKSFKCGNNNEQKKNKERLTRVIENNSDNSESSTTEIMNYGIIKDDELAENNNIYTSQASVVADVCRQGNGQTVEDPGIMGNVKNEFIDVKSENVAVKNQEATTSKVNSVEGKEIKSQHNIETIYDTENKLNNFKSAMIYPSTSQVIFHKQWGNGFFTEKNKLDECKMSESSVCDDCELSSENCVGREESRDSLEESCDSTEESCDSTEESCDLSEESSSACEESYESYENLRGSFKDSRDSCEVAHDLCVKLRDLCEKSSDLHAPISCRYFDDMFVKHLNDHANTGLHKDFENEKPLSCLAKRTSLLNEVNEFGSTEFVSGYEREVVEMRTSAPQECVGAQSCNLETNKTNTTVNSTDSRNVWNHGNEVMFYGATTDDVTAYMARLPVDWTNMWYRAYDKQTNHIMKYTKFYHESY
ncbi:probable ATP-dependent RNA helicase DDX20 [Xenia sp. Carnegie-2017]|uniref:probable ATP-dependent RNA helicase DDX20 n=1 Tax=Xenia sp. Carnegie-2017 TaxID=2897299 RepID=UPI001F03C1FE|nr:probable ATP-dependent RNA helicase DDX20 [Xenia sp. Carnegie-2017]